MKGIELIGGHSKSILNRNLVQFEEKVRVSKLDVIITNAKESCWILFYPDGGGGGGGKKKEWWWWWLRNVRSKWCQQRTSPKYRENRREITPIKPWTIVIMVIPASSANWRVVSPSLFFSRAILQSLRCFATIVRSIAGYYSNACSILKKFVSPQNLSSLENFTTKRASLPNFFPLCNDTSFV